MKKEDKLNKIAKNLKELRNNAGLSLRALAEEIGISHNTLASYERLNVIPTVNYAIKICEYFKVPVEYLLYGKKITTDFNDGELLKLFKEIDEYEESDRKVAKNILKKLIKNIQERLKLEKELN